MDKENVSMSVACCLSVYIQFIRRDSTLPHPRKTAKKEATTHLCCICACPPTPVPHKMSSFRLLLLLNCLLIMSLLLTRTSRIFYVVANPHPSLTYL